MVKKNKAQVHAEASSTKTVLQLLLETSKTIASEIELEKVVQKITDVATELSMAAFGAFFYNVVNEKGEEYMLYTISGVPKEKFSKFPMPRNTKIFGPTFAGKGTVRYEDVTQAPQFGKNPPYHGMPEGHLAVKSYLAVPVISLSTNEVIGGLFFGHPDPGIFTEEAEKIVEGIAAQGAIAIENARLFAQKEKTKKKLEIALNAASIGTWTFDIQKNMIMGDSNFAKFFGADPDMMAQGMSPGFFSTAMHPDDIERVGEQVKEAIATGNCFEAEYRILTPNHKYKWVLSRGQSDYDTHHHPIYLLGTLLDITALKETEEALAEQKLELQHKEETLRLAIEATDLGTWDLNPQTGELLWSNRCNELFGLPDHSQVNYKIFLKQVHPDDRERVNSVVQWVFNPKSGGEYDIEYRTLSRIYSSFRWVKAKGKAIFNEYGEAIRFLGTVLDITEQKLSRQILEEKSRALEFANEDLKNFTYTISHDIKNPLSSLLFSASVAEDFTTIEEFKEIMPLIEKNSKKINDILTGLIEIIKEEETQGNVEWLNITEVIEEVKNELSETITHNDCEIITSVHQQEIRFVRSYLQSIFRNLIDNAIKYKSPLRSPRISISVQGNKHKAEFTVSDNGMGIDLEKNKKYLFQPFKRFCEEKQGTGIGLFMIKRMVEKYGGEIDLESKPDAGTTFRFTLMSVSMVSDFVKQKQNSLTAESMMPEK